MTIHPGSGRGSDRVKPTLRQRPCNSGPHVSCSLSSVTYWFDTLAAGNCTSLRHLSIAWELTRKHARALPAINVRNHGGTMSLTGIARSTLSFSRQDVGVVHRSAIHGLSQIRRELCACHPCGPSPDHLHVYHYHLLPYKYGTANPQRSFIPRLLSSITLGHSCICIHSRPSFQRGPYHQLEDQHLRPWFSYLNTTQTHQLSSPLSVVTNSSRFLYTNNRLSINLYSPLPQPT
jgi:hypothetical protein